ncbi:putative dynactin 22 kDa subunit [Heterostelium album PN500]|uniref:Putative dynactin 22 kDa subunit n=1 Tax=Heterostelium pallidum (strain ATCC 26659 / Pp 5 / PN500) TaxID=670386 RepID=D3BAQ0_HETP5|nr:putative dynactin 22 kDa subunit [Heterostelium album PN500]EFA81637.1 putative dynactin 22 kDa subunit [Heterostelium album PN500]|eukprot:XP_020433754.1 putative dynactin 22 kDa subunit [Heterostelium album PN500]
MTDSQTIDSQTIDEIERRVGQLEIALLGYQPYSSDSVLSQPLPNTSGASATQLLIQNIQQLHQQQTQSPLITGNRKRSNTTTSSTSPLPNIPLETLVDQIDRFKSTLQHIKSDHESINQFMTLYKENEKLFSEIAENDELLTPVEKLSIILSAEDEIIYTANYLQKIAELEKFINPTTLESIPSMITQLQPIESLHNEQQAITIALNKKLESRIQSYNDIIESLSMKFAYWDKVLTDLEKKKTSTNQPPTTNKPNNACNSIEPYINHTNSIIIIECN